jgi:lipoxygenase homology domain-containing protein 1
MKNSYIIKIQTSDLLGSGTNAKVFIELMGSKQQSGEIVLDKSLLKKPTKKDLFEAGQTDTFIVKCRNVGKIRQIRIGHDNTGFAPGWHLKNVQIESEIDGRQWICECNQWFDKKEGDGKIERQLIAIPIDQLNNYEKESFALYKVLIKTSDLRNAGTDANVYIQLFGKSNKTDKIPLTTSKNHKNKFERGNEDEFEVESFDIGDDIEFVRIGHDNKGISPGWHCKQIKIQLQNGKQFVFPCNKWFSKSDDDCLIERDVYKESRDSKVVDYTISVRTSDILGAGTDANVKLKIYGHRRKTQSAITLAKSTTHRNKFERDHTDIFNLKNEEYFGDISKIKIGHDGTMPASSWHLSEVLIECKDTNEKWRFVCNRWLSKTEDDGQTVVELQPYQSVNDNKLLNGDIEYIIDVFTGDLPKAGTDANVFITFYGENNKESPEFHLKKSETHSNKFERKHKDRFRVIYKQIGYIIGIKIRHDNKGSSPDWYLDRIQIQFTSPDDDKVVIKYVFLCAKWLSLDRDDQKIERILKEIVKIIKKYLFFLLDSSSFFEILFFNFN